MDKPPIYQHAELDGNSFLWEGNETGVVLVHGFTATSVEVRQFANKLQQEGYSVAGPLLPGHGARPEDLNQKKWQYWVEATETMLLEIQKKCSNVFIGGESMGGLIAAYLAAKHPELAGLMLYAPAIKVKGLGLATLLAPFKEYVFKKNTDDSMPWQGYNVTPLKAATQLLKLQKVVRPKLSQVIIPAIVFQGKKDQTINPQSGQIVYNLLGSTQKEFVELDQSGHCILLDVQKELAFEQSISFMKSVLKMKP
jgi:carboxylesterase